jgi:hypothetical protein
MSASEASTPKIGGIASMFESTIAADKPKPESAVSSLASRFETAAAAERPAAGGTVSSKISSIAGAFEVAAASKAVTKPSTFLPKSPAKVPEKAAESAPEQTRLGVSEVAARFAGGGASAGNTTGQDSTSEPSAFRKAAGAFQEREMTGAEPAETRVSSFARQLDQAAKSGGFTGTPKDALAERRPHVEDAEVPNRFKSAAALFEGATKPEQTSSKASDTDESSLPDRFKSATTLFEDRAKGGAVAENGEETGSSRFKEASKLFGGKTS